MIHWARGAVIASLATTGCGWPPLVRVQAAPDPFKGAHEFALAPVAFRKEVTIGDLPESQYVYGMTREQQAQFATEKEAVRSAFADALRKSLAKKNVRVESGSQPFVVEPTVTWMDLGSDGASSGEGDLRVTVRVLRSGGAALDVVDFRAEASGSGRRQRMEHVADKVGNLVGDYLLTRVDRH